MMVSQISIVGAGIGGLSAALALQHFSYRVRVFEQARELREFGAGVVISPNAMHALNFLGVGERVAREAGPAGVYVSRHFETGEVLKTRPNDYIEKFGAAYHQVHRADLQAALASAVLRNEPDCVRLGYCFESLTQDSERVVATFTNGKTVTSDALIGCDGGASKVRLCVRRRGRELYRPGGVSCAGSDGRRPGRTKRTSLCDVRRRQAIFPPLSIAPSNNHERDCGWPRAKVAGRRMENPRHRRGILKPLRRSLSPGAATHSRDFSGNSVQMGPS